LANRYALLTGLRWFPIGLVVPVTVLIKEARGLDVATIGQLMALYSVVTLILELPTGGLADVIGRRGVVVLSSLTTALGLGVLAIATSVPLIAASAVLQGVGRALSSGPLTAWYVDAVHRDDADGDIQVGLSRGEAAEAFGLGVGAVLGGLLPGIAAVMLPGLDSAGTATLITLSIPLLIGSLLAVVHAVLTWTLVREPVLVRKSMREVTRGVPQTVVEGLRLGTRDLVLRRLMLRMVLVGVAISAIELLTPLSVAELAGGNDQGSAVFGVLSGVGFLGTTAGALLAPRAARAAGSGVRVVVIASFTTAGLAALLALPLLGVVCAAYVLAYAVLGLVGPLIAHILHDRVNASVRSTVLSVESLAMMFGGLVGSLGVAALADAVGLAWGYAVVTLAFVLAGCLMLRLPRNQSADENLGDGQGAVRGQVEV
jgi:MFS family permease